MFMHVCRRSAAERSQFQLEMTVYWATLKTLSESVLFVRRSVCLSVAKMRTKRDFLKN